MDVDVDQLEDEVLVLAAKTGGGRDGVMYVRTIIVLL